MESSVLAGAKCTKIRLQNFMIFQHAEINLQDGTTIIEAMKQPPQVINNFTTAFKFIFNNSVEVSENDFQIILDNNTSLNDSIFVEAHILAVNGVSWIFCKVCDIQRHEVVYKLNDTEVPREEFQCKLIELGFELDSSFIIDSQAIERITMMPDNYRSIFIEKFCSSSEELNYYRQLEVKIEALTYEIKMSLYHKKTIKAEEKTKLSKLEILTKLKESCDKLLKQHEQLMLYQLYHNNKECIETRPEAIRELQEALKEIKTEFTSTLAAYKDSLSNYQTNKVNLDESFFKIGERIKATFTYEQLQQMFQQKVNSLEITNENALGNILLPRAENGIVKYQKNLDDLIALKEKVSPLVKEYERLRRKFDEENVKLSGHRYAIKQKLSIVTKLKKTREFNVSKVMELAEERKIFGQNYAKLKLDSEANKNEIEALTTKLTHLENISSHSQKFITKLENVIARFPNASNKSKSSNIVEILQEKFSCAVVGRLCDLFEVAPANGIDVKRIQILQRLGKYAQTIVVDTNHTAEQCIEFMKNHQDLFLNETLTPLTICQDSSIDTAEVLKNYVAPDDIKVEAIENFIIAKHPQIQKLIMHLLKTTVVCEEKFEIPEIFESLQKKVQVTSFNGSATFKPSGYIDFYLQSMFTNVELSLVDDENFLKIIETLQDCRLKFCDLRAEIYTKKLQLTVLQQKQLLFDYYSDIMTQMLERNAQSIANVKKNVEIVESKLLVIENKKEYRDAMEKLEEIKIDLFVPEKELFDEFLECNGYSSIEKFEEDFQKVLNFDALYKVSAQQLEINQNYKNLFALDQQRHLKDLEEANKNLRTSQNKIDESKQKLENLKENNQVCYKAKVESLKQFLKVRGDCVKAEEKLETTMDKLCKETLNIQIAMAENFNILLKALYNHDVLHFTTGSIVDILRVPNISEVDGDINIIQQNLEGIEINFDRLKPEFKTNVDIAKKRFELEKDLREIKESLEQFALDVTGDHEHIHHLKVHTRDLMQLTQKLNTSLISVNEEFQRVSDCRKQRFNECLTAINREIGNFCTIALKGKAQGELKAIDSKEPFSSGVQFNWRVDGEEQSHNDKKRNYDAAFAFLMGIIKFRKQQFVFLNNSAKIVGENTDLNSLREYLNATGNLQVVALITHSIKTVESHCNYVILKRGERCFVMNKV